MAQDIVVSVEESSADVEIGVGQIQVFTQVQDVANLSDILDVDTSNLDGSTNKYVMIFDAVRQKYVFVNPDAVLDSSVGISTSDPSPVGMSTATLDYLDQALDDRIDLDAGEW
jgi:hypothetical protein